MREDTAIRRDVLEIRCLYYSCLALARDAKAIWLIDALDTSHVSTRILFREKTPAVIEQDRIRVSEY